MTTVTKLKDILEVLEKNGKGGDLIQADHDIVYLSSASEDAPFAEEIKKAGARHSDEFGWYVYV